MNQLLSDVASVKHILVGSGINVMLCHRSGCVGSKWGYVVNFISSIFLGIGSIMAIKSAIDLELVEPKFLTDNTKFMFEFCVATLGISSIAYLATKINKLLDILINRESVKNNRVTKIEGYTNNRVTNREGRTNDYYD